MPLKYIGRLVCDTPHADCIGCKGRNSIEVETDQAATAIKQLYDKAARMGWHYLGMDRYACRNCLGSEREWFIAKGEK